MGKSPDIRSLVRAACGRRGLGLAALVAVLVLLLATVSWWALRPEQPSSHIVTVGAVQLTAVDDATFEGFKAGMTALGYVEGRHIRYLHPGPAGTIDRLDSIIAGHLARKVDLLYVSSTPAALAAKRATRDNPVPVVFAPVNDPVASGVVASLLAPGGNLTGVRLPQGDAMRLQWLLQIAPEVRRVLIPHNPNDQSALESLRQLQELSSALKIDLIRQPVDTPEAINRGLRELPRNIDALLLPRDSSIEARIADYAAVALERKIPLCAPSLTQVHAGALLSYGFVHFEIGRQAARLAHQILIGVPPAQLPVETARSYLAINLRTAQSIGLVLPDSVLRGAHLLVR